MNSDESGFTLVEVMLSTFMLTVLTLVLLSVVRQTMAAVRSNKALSRMMSNLNTAGQQLTEDLRNVSRQFGHKNYTFRFVGLDGDGGTFKYTGKDPTRPNSPQQQDQLHIVGLYYFVSRSDESVNEQRLRFGYFLNDGSYKYFEDVNGDGQEEWGLLTRNTKSTVTNPSTLDPLEIETGDLSGAQALAYNVDRLSFRYYDKESDQWVHNWDSAILGTYPDTVEFAIRAYDPYGNVDPQWYLSAVYLSHS